MLETSQIIELGATPSRIRALSFDEGERIISPHKDSNSWNRGASEYTHMPDHDNSSGWNLHDLYFFQTVQYPLEDHADNPLPNGLSLLFPQFSDCWTNYRIQNAMYSFFVLTNNRGKKMYGTCHIVYEELLLDQRYSASEDENVAFDGIKNNKGTLYWGSWH